MSNKASPWLVNTGLLILAMAQCSLIIMNASVTLGQNTTDPGPLNFTYTDLWTSQDGETHVAECLMHGFRLQLYSTSPLPQYVRSNFSGSPTTMVFTELPVNLTQPLHSPPSVQIVVTLSGSWYIQTTDGTRRVFVAGEVLFQDNIVTSPADKVPQHYSGNAGDVPCQQFVVQFNRTAEVDNPCPFN